MPEIIYESEYKYSGANGRVDTPAMRIKLNDVNKFCTISWLYFADPAKRSAEWESEAMAGIPRSGWLKEYWIDYTATAGDKVFPEIAALRDSIIIQPFQFEEDDPDVTFFGGMDYGSNSPSSFHCYAIKHGTVYVVWEFYQPCKNIPDMAQALKRCPYWNKIRYIAADPQLWYNTQQVKSGNITSIYSFFVDCGIHNMIKGLQDEQTWVAKMREHWKDPEIITFKIFSHCQNIIQEFENAVFAKPNLALAIRGIVNDALAAFNNHAMDDCKYFINSRPEGLLARKPIKWPTMINRWK
jgi:hypothetical protein